jgi:hypothetical protein
MISIQDPGKGRPYMYRKLVPLLGLAVTGAALAACGGPAAGAAPAAASHIAATRSAGPRPGSSAGASAKLKSHAGNGPRTSAPPASPPSAPGPASSSHGSGAPLADGLYTDAPEGKPRYIMALALSGRSVITGSVSYLYQDGRISTVGRYTGKLSGSGKLTMVLGGKALAGTYADGKLTLVGCSSVLAWAANSAGCRFTYHGHVS